MKLTVLNVAYPLAPVGPQEVGGAEQVLSRLDRALTRTGHNSIVIATSDSTVYGRHVTIAQTPAPYDHDAVARARQSCRNALQAVLSAHAIDVVHMHGVDFAEYLPAPNVPVLATLHLPIQWYSPGALRPARPATWLNCVSQTQHAVCPPSPSLIDPIRNGVTIDDRPDDRPYDRPYDRLLAKKGRYALVLGRICPEKGVHIAMNAAARAGVPLVIAGKVFPYPAHLEYFEQAVTPRLGSMHSYIGPVWAEKKHRILASARCLIVASLVPETGSLVAMEALAAGTPVVAFANGALPEIIDHGKTGLLVSDEDEMAAAIEQVDRLSPQACRTAARERFDVHQMIDQYFAVYEKIAQLSSRRPGQAA
jgi:glycosyltransferase involved in cell wall biosynthesis